MNVDYEIIYTCPRCHSENISSHVDPVLFDGVEYGYRTMFSCGQCWHEFDKPEEIAAPKFESQE